MYAPIISPKSPKIARAFGVQLSILSRCGHTPSMTIPSFFFISSLFSDSPSPRMRAISVKVGRVAIFFCEYQLLDIFVMNAYLYFYRYTVKNFSDKQDIQEGIYYQSTVCKTHCSPLFSPFHIFIFLLKTITSRRLRHRQNN